MASAPSEEQTYQGRTYWGESLFEHAEDSTEEERLQAVWSSLDNPRAFAPTKASLLNLLADHGFSSAYECHLPAEPDKPTQRITLVARAGERVEPILTPAPQRARLPESSPQRKPLALARRLRSSLPAPATTALRRALGRPTPPRR